MCRHFWSEHFDVYQKQSPKVFYEKAVLKNFAISAGKHLSVGVSFQ